MFLELVLATALVGQCDYIPVQCPPIVECPTAPTTVYHIRNLSAPEQTRNYIQIRLVDLSTNYSMTIPVINGVVPTVTPCAGYAEFILDYRCKPPTAFDPAQYSGVTVFDKVTTPTPKKAVPLQSLPRPLAPTPQRAPSPRPLTPIPRRAPSPKLSPPQSPPPILSEPQQDIRSKMKRPSQIQ